MFDHFPKKYRIRHSLGATSMLVSGRTRVQNHRQNPQCFFSVGLEMGLHEHMQQHPQVMKVYDIWSCPPAQHSRTIIFLVGDPELNLHLPLLLGGGTTQVTLSSHPEASCLKLPGHDGAQTHISSRWLNPAFEKKAPKKMGSSFPITWG